MNITLDASDFAQLADYWKRAPIVTRARLKQAVTASDLLLQKELKKDPRQGGLPRGASGAAGLAGSVATEETWHANAVIGMVYAQVPYAQYVEIGTKPHTPPIQPLLDWVKVKLGMGVERGEKGRGVAYAIRSAIAKRGTRPKPVWVPAWQANQAKVRAYFDEAMAAIARYLMKKEGA